MKFQRPKGGIHTANLIKTKANDFINMAFTDNIIRYMLLEN